MNVLSREQQIAILRALVEGNSMRATARITGVARNTISDLLRDVGAHCKNHHDRRVMNVTAKRVQADEAWSFCGKKDKRAKPEERMSGLGDAWTWVAIEQDSKLVISYRIGVRSARMAESLMFDLRERTVGRFQLTTDALHQYLGAVEKAFTWGGVDYSMLKKVFAPSQKSEPKSGERKYSPGEVIAIEKLPVMGKPESASISTSHIERSHLTLRMQSRRYTRLTNAFSKKLEFHLYATALHFAYYNWCRPHLTLTKNAGTKTTPAMAAGISKRVWDLGDLLDLLRGE